MTSSERGPPNDNTSSNSNHTQTTRNTPLQHSSQQQHSRHLHHHHLQDMEYYPRMDSAQTHSQHPGEISSRNDHPALPPPSYHRPEGEEEELEVIGSGHSNTVEHEPLQRLPRVLPNLHYGPPTSSVQNFSPGTSLVFNAYRGHRTLLVQPYMAPEEDERDLRIQGRSSIDHHHPSPQGHYQHPPSPREQPPHQSPSDPAAHFSYPKRSLEHSPYRAARDRQYHPYHDNGHQSDPRDAMDYQDPRDYRGSLDRHDFDSPHVRAGQRSPRMAPPPIQRRSSSPTRVAYHPESLRGPHDQPLRAQSNHVMQLPPIVQRLVSDPGQGGSQPGSRRAEMPFRYPPSNDYRESPVEYRTTDARQYDDPRSVAPPYSDFRTPLPPPGPRPTEPWDPSSSELNHSYTPSPAIDIPTPRQRSQASHFPEDDLEGPAPLHTSSLPTHPTQPMYSSSGMADGTSPFQGTFQNRGPRYELNHANYKMIFEYASEVRECLLKGKVGMTDRLLYNAEILSKVFMGCRVDQDPNDLPEDEAAHNPHQLRCTSCNIFKTPEWRKGPLGPRTLCNACGLIWGKMSRSKAALAAKSKALLQDADTTAKGDAKPSTAVDEPSSSSSAVASKKRGREAPLGEEYKDEEGLHDYESRSRNNEDDGEVEAEIIDEDDDVLEGGDQVL